MNFVWVLVALAVVLAGLGWLQLRLIDYLRQSASRYRWFELFTCVFLIAFGSFLLIRVAREIGSVGWIWVLGAGSILSGLTSLENRAYLRRVRSRLRRDNH